VYFFTDHVSLAFEGGFDRVWSGQHLYDGWLRKFERALKKAILNRRNALFYKTLNGAHTGDLFMTLIHTCELN
jgi:hypothetical protein